MKYKRRKTNVSRYISFCDEKERKSKIKKASFKKRLISAAVLIVIMAGISRLPFVNSDVVRAVFKDSSEGRLKGAVSFFNKTGETIADLCMMIFKDEKDEKTSAYAETESMAFSDAETNSAAESAPKEEAVFVFEPLNPCPGRISSDFGERVHPLNSEVSFHNGIDIAVEGGTEIRACFDGVVETSEYNEFSGNYIIINHGNEYTSSYAHLSQLSVQKGETVQKGQVIGLSGSTGNATGPHLHFEIRQGGTPLNPMELIE